MTADDYPLNDRDSTTKASQLNHILSPYNPRLLETSKRGDGLNAVRTITLDGRPVILKTYGQRRGPVRTLLTNTEHFLTSRTGYLPRARRKTELSNLLLWKQAGITVPEILNTNMSLKLPVPFLLIEYVEGPLLSSLLTNKNIDHKIRSDALTAFLKEWSRRHDHAEKTDNARFIHEHATMDHVIISRNGPVTFDLEVSYRGHCCLIERIAKEITAYLRSALKLLSPEQQQWLLDLTVKNYPDTARLKKICDRLLSQQFTLTGIIHSFDRHLASRKQTLTRYDVAELLQSALNRQ